jgi:hypothetical protein
MKILNWTNDHELRQMKRAAGANAPGKPYPRGGGFS